MAAASKIETAIVPTSVDSPRIILICGLPASLTYLATDLARDMLHRANGACEIVHLNDLSETTVERLGAITAPAVGLGEVPDAAIASMARDSHFPILIIDQKFSNASRDFMASREASLQEAVRTMARAQIGINPLVDIPRTRMLAPDEGTPAIELVRWIAVGIGISDEVLQPMIAERQLERTLRDVLDATFAHKPLDADEERDDLLHQLECFYSALSGEQEKPLTVPIGTLLEGAPPHLPATNCIELLGPARCLTFGPFLFLPEGRWVANFTFSSSGNQSTNLLGFDIIADTEIKSDSDYMLDKSGVFSFRANFEITDRYRAFEVRSHLRRGAIDGRFTPVSISLERDGAMHSP